MKRWTFCVGIVAVLLAGGCLLPPMDPDLSRAYKTAQKLDLEARIGPVSPNRSIVADTIYFLPSKSYGPEQGVLVFETAGRVELAYVEPSGPEDWRLEAWRDFAIDNSSSKGYNFQVHMQKVDPPSTIDYFVLHDPGVANDLLGLEYFFGSNNINDGGVAPNNPFSWSALTGSGQSRAGVSFSDIDDTLPPDEDESLAILEYQAGTGDFQDYRFASNRIAWNGAPTGASGFVTPQLTGAAPTGFYHYNPVSATRAYSSYKDGRYRTYVWDNALVSTLISPDDRIDLLLSGDLLYNRGEKVDTVYDRNGDKKYQFASGDLYLAYERFVAGVPTLYFTLVYAQIGDGDDELFINVYSLPTADLGDLD